MFDPPILDGAKIFIYIAVGLIACGAAVAIIDVLKNAPKKDDSKES